MSSNGHEKTKETRKLKNCEFQKGIGILKKATKQSKQSVSNSQSL